MEINNQQDISTISKIFDIVPCNGEQTGQELIDTLPIFYISDKYETSSKNGNIWDYYFECIKREISYTKEQYKDLIQANLTNYIELEKDNNPNLFSELIKSLIKINNIQNLDIITSYFKYLNENKYTSFVKLIKKELKSLSLQVRTEQIYKLCNNNIYMRDVFFGYECIFGRDYDKHSILSYFIEENNSADNLLHRPYNVEQFMRLYLNNMTELTKLIHDILIKNTDYTKEFDFIGDIDILSSPILLTFIVQLLINLITKCSHLALNNSDRKTYEFLERDNYSDKLVTCFIFGLKIWKRSLEINIEQNKNKELDMRFNIIGLDRYCMNLIKECAQYRNQMIHTLECHSFNSAILAVFDEIAKTKVILSNYLFDIFISHFSDICFKSKVIIKPSVNIVVYLIQSMASNKLHKHIHFNIFLIINNIIDFFDFSYIEQLQVSNLLFKNLLNFINTNNIFEYIEPKKAYAKYQNLMVVISYLADKLRIAGSVMEEDNITNIKNSIFKISSRHNESYDNLVSFIKEIVKKYPHNPLLCKKHHQDQAMTYIKTCHNSVKCLTSLLNSNLIETEKLPSELMMPISILTVSLVDWSSNGKNPIYEVFNMHKETAGLINVVFRLINTCAKNKYFLSFIQSSGALLKEVLMRTNIEDKFKKEIIEVFNVLIEKEKEENECEEDIPEEFLDPLLNSLIKEPILIPKQEQFFDRSSIMGHLMISKTNPYNREPLSVSELEEFNNLADNKDKLYKFKQKLDTYLIDKKMAKKPKCEACSD